MSFSRGAYRQAWWDVKKGDNVHRHVCAQFRWLDKEQSHTRMRNLMHLRLYSNRFASTMSGASFATYQPWLQDHLRLNVCQAIVDAAVAQAASNEIRPMPLTTGGDWAQQERAKKLQLYFDGKFHQLGQHGLSMQVFSDAGIFGTGVEKVYPGFGAVQCERVMVDNIVVDDIESQYGFPQQLFEYREVPRDNLIARYPKYKKQIEDATELLRQDHWGRHRLAMPVSVIEAYKLPTYPGAGDGRHVIALPTVTLLDEEWTRPRFPYASMRWKVAPVGWYGLGAIEEVMPIQLEINFMLEKKQAMLTHASYQLWVKKGTVVQADLNNDDRTVRQYTETPPVSLPINTGSQEIDAHIDRLYRWAFESTGISMMQAQAQKPAGLSSGEALRTYNDIASARFMHVLKRFESFHTEIAQLLMDAERDLREASNDDVEFDNVLAPNGKGSLDEVDFAKCDIDENKLRLQVFPTSMLPARPEGKLAFLKDLGEISPAIQEQMTSALKFPDTERALSMVNAPIDMADWLIDQMLTHGKYMAPDPRWGDLDLVMKRANQALLRAEIDGAPESNLALLYQFVDDCAEAVAGQTASVPAPSAPQAMPGPMGMPQLAAPPMAAPAALPAPQALPA
jgi:hypothetical protein